MIRRIAHLAAAVVIWAQEPRQAPMRVGKGMTPPSVVRKVEPEYSQQAREAGLQGKVLLSIVVTEEGRADKIEVVSPLGFGLDERAIRAVEQWVFKPGIKEGKPVPIFATIEVNFRFEGEYYDEGLERRRTSYNAAINALRKPDASKKSIEHARESLQKLEKQKYPPAMLVMGYAYLEGEWVPKDEARAQQLIDAAAKKNYGPAIFEQGRRKLAASPENADAAWKQIRDASMLGSAAAQEFLGDRYAAGLGVEKDEERARRYYRLCATGGTARCQFRLAELLLAKRGGGEYDKLQAYAWAGLAAEKGFASARQIADVAESLSEGDRKWVERLREQLIAR